MQRSRSARSRLIYFFTLALSRLIYFFTLALSACADRDDTAAAEPVTPAPAVTIRALTWADFEAGVPADGIVVSLHQCQTEPLRCEPVGWTVIDGMVAPLGQHQDYRLVWLR